MNKKALTFTLFTGLLLVGMLQTSNVYASEPFSAMPFNVQSGNFTTGQSVYLNFSAIVRKVVLINISLFGDFFILEPNWSLKWLRGITNLSSLNQWKDLAFNITIPSDAMNKTYGLTLVGYANHTVVWQSSTWFNVNSTNPYKSPPRGHNYTLEEHPFITRDDALYDWYLPLQTGTYSYTTWFIYRNETSVEPKRFYLSMWDNISGGTQVWDQGVWLTPNVEYAFTHYFHEQIWGGIMALKSAIADHDFIYPDYGNESNYLDVCTVYTTMHCPAGDYSPPPVESQQMLAIPDVNYDNKIDMKDIAIAVIQYNTNPSLPNWIVEADVNGDRRVDMRDIAELVAAFNIHR